MGLIELREDAKAIREIAERAGETLKDLFEINLGAKFEVAPTITHALIVEAIMHINEHKTDDSDTVTEVDLAKLVTIGVDYLEDEEGEKEGNFVPYVRPTELLLQILQSGEMPKIDRAFLEDELSKHLADRTNVLLKNHYNVNINDRTEIILATAFAFIADAVLYLNEHKVTDADAPVSINLMQMFDLGIGYIEEEDVFLPFMRAGQEMKLLIKDDNVTEED